MTQGQKDLLLKDLSTRLPYGVILNCCNIVGEKLYTIDSNRLVNKDYDLEEVKPYLFPLSSTTEEQLKEMQEIIGNPNEACISVNTAGLELWLDSVDTDPTIWLDTIFEVQDWLNRNHFDYRGLIEKGLAIEVTEENNPYKR